jgi:hypothetical protein
LNATNEQVTPPLPPEEPHYQLPINEPVPPAKPVGQVTKDSSIYSTVNIDQFKERTFQKGSEVKLKLKKKYFIPFFVVSS